MNPNEKNLSFRILVLITSPKLAQKATELYHEGGVPVHYRLNGMGTASSEMLDILGIGSSDKIVLVSMMPKTFADKMLLKLHEKLKFGVPGNGIAFTLPMSGANNHILRILKECNSEDNETSARKEKIIMADTKSVLIASVVNQGYSNEVMDAARAAGAKGGTILNSRRMGDEQTMSFWGLSLQEEKEMVMVIADSENKMQIMQAISEKCGMHSEAKGIVLSLPIDTVIGLNG